MRAGTRGISPRAPRRLRLAPLAAAVMVVCGGATHAATIAVNDSNEDSVSGKCTLADAVQAVNTASAVNGCVAGNGTSDTIDLSFFAAATSISFTLPNSADGQSALGLTKPATITGPLGTDGKPLVTIQRSSATPAKFRVIGTSADLTLHGVAITGGNSPVRGAGVYASGTANLTITNSVISGNVVSGNGRTSGGGVASEYGSITLTSSTVSGNSSNGNGGGVYTLHQGTITLNNSTVGGNHAYYRGGGIYSFNGDVTLNASTVSGNSIYYIETLNGNTYRRGGDYGGGIYVYKSVHLTNSTVANNYAHGKAGGVWVGGKFYGGRPARPRPTGTAAPQASTYQSGNAYLYFSTISGNKTGADFQLNSGLSHPNYLHAVGSIITGNLYGNLELAPLAYARSPQFVGSNNVIGSPPSRAPADTLDCDPMLGTLGDYGGPTQTLPLLNGSCAIDVGPDTLPNGITTDQRGSPRPAGTKSDIGAFEKQGLDDPPDAIFANGFDT